VIGVAKAEHGRTAVTHESVVVETGTVPGQGGLETFSTSRANKLIHRDKAISQLPGSHC
jgi:hypothetical protein